MAVLLILSLFVPLILLLLFLHPSNKGPNLLPPGPRPWPVVGNLFDLFLLQVRKRQPLHAALASIAHAHGPLIHLRLGTRPLIVASTSTAASQILKTHDRILSARHVPAVFAIPMYTDYSLVWAAGCDDRWKSLRSLCRAELFSPKSLENGVLLREEKAGEMVGFISGKEGEEVRLGELVFRVVFNMIGNVVFSRDVIVKDGEGWLWDLKKQMARSLELGAAPNLEDFYPAVLGGLDLQGLRREVMVFLKRIYALWDDIIGERRREMEGGGGGEDVKEDFLKILLGSGYGDLQLKALIQDIFTAGTDTSSLLIEWTMSELIRNPEVMQQVRDELERAFGEPKKGENTVKEDQLIHLTYLQACIQESLRLHPPAPLLLPHRAVESCEVMNYTVPKGSIVMVNAWAIGRDPETWKDPLMFSPERFLLPDKDYRVMDFKLLPFGGGRRMCPGLQLSNRIVPLVLASLIHNFKWLLPDGTEPGELNMNERPGLTPEREQPLVLIPMSPE